MRQFVFFICGKTNNKCAPIWSAKTKVLTSSPTSSSESRSGCLLEDRKLEKKLLCVQRLDVTGLELSPTRKKKRRAQPISVRLGTWADYWATPEYHLTLRFEYNQKVRHASNHKAHQLQPVAPDKRFENIHVKLSLILRPRRVKKRSQKRRRHATTELRLD